MKLGGLQEQQPYSFRMGAARSSKNGIIPPTKEVHHMFYSRNADFVRTLARDAPPSGSNATLPVADNFLPGYPVVLQKIVVRYCDLDDLLTFSISICPAYTGRNT